MTNKETERERLLTDINVTVMDEWINRGDGERITRSVLRLSVSE